MPRTRVAARGHRPRNYRGARPRWRLVRTQREVICEVMRSAPECGTWLTLRELALLTRQAGVRVRRLLGSLSRGARSARDQAWRFRARFAGHREISLAAGHPPAAQRIRRRLRAGRRSGARRAELGFADDSFSHVLPGPR